MRQIAGLDVPILAVDSNVHANANDKDFARWWMLPGMDSGAPDGPTDPEAAAQGDAYRAQHPMDYRHLPRPFHGSVQTAASGSSLARGFVPRPPTD